MRQLLDNIINAADASVNQVSAAIPTENMLYISVQVVMTGSSSGALKLQASNDVIPVTNPLTAPTNWADISGATVTLTGTAGVFLIPLTNLCYQYVRAVYTHNNGSAGTITATAKGIGA